jgi:glutamate carboxypeptidase
MKKTLLTFKRSHLAVVGILFCLLPSLSAAQSISPAEQKIIDTVNRNFDNQVNFLRNTVNINSGTMNVSGVQKVANIYQKAFKNIGMNTERAPLPKLMKRAAHLVATSIHGNVDKVNDILLIGHLDTVFAKNSDFQTFKREGNNITGPGVTDMKDGNSIIVYALQALYEQNLLSNANVRVILNSDEESVGRPIATSRAPMITLAKKSDYALSFESGWQNAASIARRGNTSWTLSVEAKRAHSSGIFSENTGAGAVFETSRILNNFYNQIRGESGLTFNPGLIAGGTEVNTVDKANLSTFGKTNIVAKSALVKGDMRFISNEQREAVKNKMEQIVAVNLPKTSASIEFNDSYPAMVASEENQQLLSIFSKVSADLGYGNVTAFPAEKRGAGDAAFVSPYVATIDGLGASGGGSHSKSEHLNVDSLKMATIRAAILIYRLSQNAGQ